MAKYRVEIAYQTKREAVIVGCYVDAFGPNEAEEIARDKVLKGYPARRLAYSTVQEASP